MDKIHGSGELLSLNDLRDCEPPPETRTYKPLGFYDMAMSLQMYGKDVLEPNGFKPKDLKLKATSGKVKDADGNPIPRQRLFFIYVFENSDTEVQLAIAGRNSYDKSMSLQICSGANVFICTNLMISAGDKGISYVRKHTGDIKTQFETHVITTMVMAAKNWDNIRFERDRQRDICVDLDRGYQLMGKLKAKTATGPASGRQLDTNQEWSRVQNELETPPHDHGADPLWAWRKALTLNYKELPMERQLARHESLARFTTMVN